VRHSLEERRTTIPIPIGTVLTNRNYIRRHDQVGEVATLTEALQVQLLDHVDVAGIGRRISTLPGEVS
jgi:hypothetical protein